MTDNTATETKALLVSVDTGDFDNERSLEELKELAKTAEVEVAAILTQKRPALDSATCIGDGKLAEALPIIEEMGINLAIFDHELTANQTRNIENILDIRVIDRTTLILDIFAQRALSKEGRIQVELAQQRYRLPRLAGKGVEMSRLGGGVGTRGPGETKLETDKRHIRRRIEFLEAELKELEKRRELHRARRKKDGVLTAAIVGYTNVGKSTLLNALTDAGVIAENKLFATLDITSRSIELPDGRSVLLVDTVGLISRLPHHLVEAFKSTLEEAANSDIILHISDISSDDAAEQAKVTKELLAELGCEGIPVIDVLNKCDCLQYPESIKEDDTTVKISAKNKEGFDRLLACIAKNLPETAKRAKLLIPYDKTALLNLIREDGKVFSEEYTENGTFVDALVDIKIFHKAEPYITD